MKKSIYTIIISLALSGGAYAQQTNDPKTNPGPVDLKSHPELIANAVNGVKNGRIAYHPKNSADSSTVQGKNKQVIRDIIATLVQNNIANDRSGIRSFMLTSTTLTVNDKEQPADLQQQLKMKYIIAPDFVVYYGNSEKTGKGIFQRTDNL